ncbi:hypothetical protein MHH33_12860 [Paenisporosarcina sp. FSL H8-0542]|uniref:hypothetical protein n=1 Tax=Paenisporosarcina sp. FSL H8-0542 TaxID=2921401 RepID=UPI003159CD68
MEYKRDLEQKRKEALALIEEWERRLEEGSEIIVSNINQITENGLITRGVKSDI